MTINKFSPVQGMFEHSDGDFMRVVDHQDEVLRLKGIINSLYDQLSEISSLKDTVEKLKPSMNSSFVVKYREEGTYKEHIKYHRWFNHAVKHINELQKDPNVFSIRAFALTEVPIVDSLTIQL